MRKNLTISLSGEDWERLQSVVRETGMTYSGVFHRLLAVQGDKSPDQRKIEKYRSLLAPHAEFLAGRARRFAKAGKRRRPSA